MQNRFYQFYNPEKNELDLSQQTVGDADVSDLVNLLDEKQDVIQSLLINCEVMDTNFDTIRIAIQACTALTTFALDYSALTDTQLVTLAVGINPKNLTSLSIKSDALEDNGLGVITLINRVISKCKLKSFSLDGKNLGPNTTLNLALSLAVDMLQLEAFHLRGDAIKHDILCHLAMCKNPNPGIPPLKLKSLSIAGQLIDDLNVFHLACFISTLPDLVSIKIQGNQMTDKGIDCIAQAIRGEPIRIKLDDGRFYTATGGKRVLTFGKTFDTNEGTQPLKNLKSLSIQSDQITEEGINTLNTLFETNQLSINVKTSEEKSKRLVPTLLSLCIFQIRNTYTENTELGPFLDVETLPIEMKERTFKK